MIAGNNPQGLTIVKSIDIFIAVDHNDANPLWILKTVSLRLGSANSYSRQAAGKG